MHSTTQSGRQAVKMVEQLIKTLEPLGYPVRRQGSLGESEKYPESFFTFWNNNSYDESFYDNHEHSAVWDFDLNFYSSDPKLTYTVLQKAKEFLKKEGFIVDGQGYDVLSDEPTHTGRGINVLIQNDNKED